MKLRPHASNIVLEAKNLSAWYGLSLVLEDISISFKRNMITAIIGPSGCGKSTLLRCFNRVNDMIIGFHAGGEVLLDGESIYKNGVGLMELRNRVGMVFQRPNPFPKSIYDNVAFGPRINGYQGNLDEIVELSLKRAALWDEVKNKLHTRALALSGGQQQRLCLARALAVEPEVILMDEPTSALDPKATARIEDLIEELKADYTIAIVTHSMQQAARVSDFTAFLLAESPNKPARLIEFGETDRIFTNPTSELTERYITGRFG